jgi:hypothetical protein
MLQSLQNRGNSGFALNVLGELMNSPLRSGIYARIFAAAVFVTAAPASWSATIHLASGGEMEFTYQAVGTAPIVTVDDYILDVPGQYSFDGTFASSQEFLPVLSTLSSVGPYTFLDSYVFAVTEAASGNALTASLELGSLFDINNLQMRIYKVTGAGATLPVIGSLQPLILSGDVALVTPWIGPPIGQTTVVGTFYNITAGTYVLDIAGTAVGQNGGLYVGSLNLAPVPVPAAVWLLASGLGALGAAARRRRQRA